MFTLVKRMSRDMWETSRIALSLLLTLGKRVWTMLWAISEVATMFGVGVAAIALFAIVLVSCTAGIVAPTSDSDFSYAAGSSIPIDNNFYTVAGTVVADVADRTTGQEKGHITGSAIGAGNFTSMQGTYFPGDVFVRLSVELVNPSTELAPQGNVVLLKTTDLKAVALLPGDYVTFVCRAQYEAVAATNNAEAFDADKAGTWELDYCRLNSPVISEGE